MDMENESFSLCEKVRYALIFEEQMGEEMTKHMCECHLCRTALEQHKKIASDLSGLKMETLMKNGKSVSESVMEEIQNQSVFTGTRPVNGRFTFKHAGLVAACIIITVMALPVMNSILPGSKSQDSAVLDMEMQYNNSVSGTESAEEKYNGKFEIVADKSTSETGTEINDLYDGADIFVEESCDIADQEAPKEPADGANSQNKLTNGILNDVVRDDSVKSEGYLYEDMKDYGDTKFKDSVMMAPSEPAEESQDTDVSEEEALETECEEIQALPEQTADEVLYEIALQAANDYSSGKALVIKELISVNAESEGHMCAVFITESKEQIYVILEKDETGFKVLKVYSEK